MENEKVKYYEERRKELAKIRSDSMESLDKAALQLSTGALVITITFIDKIGKPYNTFTNVLLITFWFLFLVVILLNIFSYYSAQKNMDFKISDLDKRFKECPENWQNISERFSKWKKSTEVCNKLALGFFIFGAILFFLYAYLVQNQNYELTHKQEVNKMVDKSKFIEDILKEVNKTKITRDGIKEYDVAINTEKPINVIVHKGQTEIPEIKIPQPGKQNKEKE